MKHGSLWMLSMALFLVPGPSGFTETLMFQDGVAPTQDYAGSADVHIISFDGSGNQTSRPPAQTPQNTGMHTFIEEGDYGDAPSAANPDLSLDSKVILIRFDISTIPVARANEVMKAEVGLYFVFERVKGGGDPAAGLRNPHNLNTQKILKNWAEGFGTGVDGIDAEDNTEQVTWNSTGYELWEAIGAEGPTDVGPVESSTLFDPVPGTWIWFDVTQMCREWIAGPSANFGVKISQETDNDPTNAPTVYVVGCYDFASRENDEYTEHPQLRIEMGTPVTEWDLM
ncbi:MAG TPA: DNRLRE domain-containing protein [bacterium]|nr:DNRLRE domain-containing protein [bacterium]